MDLAGGGASAAAIVLGYRRSRIGRLRPPLQERGPSPPLCQRGWPFRETYRYFDLPFSTPEHITEKKATLGEVLNGDRLVEAPYKLDFRVDIDYK
ncbi:hypothetical protein C4D60_Mb06t07100 [Musa balbisiana]|uniref:Uncharacterized protein n=1 Tax=Musa balbisiana TaxID=52838 RepID=A0A4S8IL92_MUSBA|nr:hypothetical protein C4D60_Mb06t07100 [Musa balbisiana]